MNLELAALRMQEWLHTEHELLVSVQDVLSAMQNPMGCPFTEAHFSGAKVEATPIELRD